MLQPRFLCLLSLSLAYSPRIFADSASVATPAFSVSPGTYRTTQTITIRDETPGVSIHYTTSGLAPKASSALYTEPIEIKTTKKLRAIAVSSNGAASAVKTGVYTITSAAIPSFSVAPGNYQTTQIVAIHDEADGAAIYYTTSGLAPTTSSTPYTGPISISKTIKLRAIAVFPNGPPSAVKTAVYTITPAPTPTFSLPAGTYQTTQTVSIHDDTNGASIYYTTSGLMPTTSSTPYTGPISISKTIKLRAIAVFPNGPPSAVKTAVYTITPAPTPTFSLPAGTYQTTQTVSIHDDTNGASIYYTTSGLMPTTSSTPYTGPISISKTIKLRAIAVFPNGPPSAVKTAVYTIASAAMPTFSPAAGKYTGTQSVRISDATSGASIYYTTNGLAPTTSATRYTGPVSIGSNMKLRAIAVFPDGPVSEVATAIYTIRQASKPIKTPNSSTTFFGMTVHDLLNGTPWPSMPIGSLRLWDTRTTWSNLNPASGKYNWRSLDQLISLAQTNDAELLYAFGGTPSWALPTNVPITSITRSSGRVTVTTGAEHGMYYNPDQIASGQYQFTISGVSDDSFNGTFYITGTPTSNTFTYRQDGSDSSSSSGTVSAVCTGGYAPDACAEAPAHLSDWEQFLTQLVSHLPSGAIRYWEMWNEPNVPNFWKGDPQTLVAMTADARQIIKAADSNAVIFSPGVTGNYETAVECSNASRYCGGGWLDHWLSLGGSNYIDGIAFHGYPVNVESPERIQGAIDLLQATMARNNVGSLPVWDTESSWGRSAALPDEGDQVAWVARHLLLEESMGIQRSFWFAFDNPYWGEFWSPNTGLNAAGVAYQEVQKWLQGTTLTGPCAQTDDDPTTFICSYSRSDGYAAQAIWNTAGTTSIAVADKFIEYRDLSGHVRSINGGTVQISTTPILIETADVF